MLNHLRRHLWVTDVGFCFAAAALSAGAVSINGFEIGSPARLAEVASRLAQGLTAPSRIDVELDRGGAAVHRVFTLL